MKYEVIYKRIAQALLIVGPLATLAISPQSNFDPINLIKVLFITSIAFTVLALVLGSFGYSFKRLDKYFWSAASLFILAMFSTLLFSGAPLDQQLWGSFGRNTGLLTYISFLFILIGTALIQNIGFYYRLVNSILITAIPVTAYALLQVANLDPIGWSEKNPFATLGNINFSSGFFGLSSICATVLILENRINVFLRIGLGVMAFTDLAIVLFTGSIQGFMVYIAGIGVAIYLFIRSKHPLRMLKIPHIFAGVVGTALTVMGLNNNGPLANFLFAPSILFRKDYWNAGWQMTLNHPIFGVGMDSYGDWYKIVRGSISTIRTGPDRMANTAHNIFLDLSSSGGVPLILGYLLLLFFALRASVRVLKRGKEFNPYFVALFTTWIAYQIMSAISINQVGVGIWGWLFTGALIGYEIATRPSSEGVTQVGRSGKSKKVVNLSAGASLVAITGFVAGFVLAFIPFNADAKYKTARNTNDLDKIIASTHVLGSTVFHSDIALESAAKTPNAASQVEALSAHAIARNPKDVFAWRVRAYWTTLSPEERTKGMVKYIELDPFNPCIRTNGLGFLKDELSKATPSQLNELKMLSDYLGVLKDETPELMYARICPIQK